MYWVEDFEEGLWTPFVGTFEAGNQYYMDVFIVLDENYILDSDCVIKVNGEANGIIIDDFIDDEDGKHYMELGLIICTAPATDEVTVTVNVNGGNPIDKTEYIGTKGQTLEEILVDLPELTHEDESLMWVWFSTDPEGENIICEDDVITENITIYALWYPAVREINLSIIPPVAGTATTTSKYEDGYWNWDSQTNLATITVVGDDTHYELDEGEYYETEDHTPFVGTFEAGEKYKAQIYLVANDNYLFAENPTITINGETTGQVLEWDGGMIAIGCEIEVPVTTYTVTLNPNGGSVTPSTLEVIESGTYGKLPTSTRSGYNPIGWFRDEIQYGAAGCFYDGYYNDSWLLRISPFDDLNNHDSNVHYFNYGDEVVFDVTVPNATISGVDLNDEYISESDYEVSEDGHNVRGHVQITDIFDIN